MTLFSANDSVQPACTNNVHRPMGDIAGLREVHDDVGRLTVSAFPFARRRSRVSTTSRPAFVTTRDRPSSWNGMAAVKSLIWSCDEARYCPSR